MHMHLVFGMERYVRIRMLETRDGGQSTVEAAFALPILLIIVLLLVQPGLYLYDRMVMQSAAAEGCRLLATGASGQTSSDESCEAFIRHRLSSIPQHECFHVHDPACTWRIELTGGESNRDVSVRISTEVKPLPLIDAMASFAGITNAEGNVVLSVEANAATQPSWAFNTSAGESPANWIGAWLE